MDYEAALAGLTKVPAEIFGMKNYGTLEVGMDADVVVWSGDPLEVTTYADVVFIKGDAIPMVSRQTLAARPLQGPRQGAVAAGVPALN